MARTVGVRFKQAGKIFYYDAGELELELGAYVVVETSHGLAVGHIVITPDQVIANEATAGEELKSVLRLATQEDVEQMEVAQEKAHEAVTRAKEKVSELGIDMAIASGEYDLDESQFTAYFTANERVDFRPLVRELSTELGVRVHLLQVGDRDRAKLVDGFDICGQRLCCSSWMSNFPSVSIRMAKEQDLPLNPQKISGVCGRLYCCLTFEYEDYKALRGTLPKVGSMISTPSGDAKVNSIDFNREVVKLYLIEQQQQVEVDAIDFKLQHGLTLRPLDLVKSIEGPLRTVSEDSSATSAAPASGAAQRRQRGRREQTAQQQAPSGGGQQQRSRRGGERQQPQAANAPRSQQPRPQQPAVQQQPSAAAAEGGEAQKRRRRRRRRGGRGGGGEGAAGPSEPAE